MVMLCHLLIYVVFIVIIPILLMLILHSSVPYIHISYCECRYTTTPSYQGLIILTLHIHSYCWILVLVVSLPASLFCVIHLIFYRITHTMHGGMYINMTGEHERNGVEKGDSYSIIIAVC